MNRFCTKCGTELVDGVCPKCSQTRQNSKARKNETSQQEEFAAVKAKML